MFCKHSEIARVAVGLALMLATSPMAGHSPTPVNGIRTALELIAGKGSAKLNSTRPVPFGTA